MGVGLGGPADLQRRNATLRVSRSRNVDSRPLIQVCQFMREAAIFHDNYCTLQFTVLYAYSNLQPNTTTTSTPFTVARRSLLHMHMLYQCAAQHSTLLSFPRNVLHCSALCIDLRIAETAAHSAIARDLREECGESTVCVRKCTVLTQDSAVVSTVVAVAVVVQLALALALAALAVAAFGRSAPRVASRERVSESATDNYAPEVRMRWDGTRGEALRPSPLLEQSE